MQQDSMSVVAKTTFKIYPECSPEKPEELSVNLVSVNKIVKLDHTVAFNMNGVDRSF